MKKELQKTNGFHDGNDNGSHHKQQEIRTCIK